MPATPAPVARRAPTMSHVYTFAATRIASMTVTDSEGGAVSGT